MVLRSLMLCYPITFLDPEGNGFSFFQWNIVIAASPFTASNSSGTNAVASFFIPFKSCLCLVTILFNMRIIISNWTILELFHRTSSISKLYFFWFMDSMNHGTMKGKIILEQGFTIGGKRKIGKERKFLWDRKMEKLIHGNFRKYRNWISKKLESEIKWIEIDIWIGEVAFQYDNVDSVNLTGGLKVTLHKFQWKKKTVFQWQTMVIFCHGNDMTRRLWW